MVDELVEIEIDDPIPKIEVRLYGVLIIEDVVIQVHLNVKEMLNY